MNLREKSAHYQRRGFSPSSATVNTLLEEALRILFASYPEAFVFFGGASLVLFYDSPRLSADLDLLVLLDSVPAPEQLIRALEAPLAESAALLGFPDLKVQTAIVGETHLKLAAASNQQILFTIDLSRISAVIRSAILEVPFVGESGTRVNARILSRDFLLFQKAESFLLRRNVKVRDVFDIKFLVEQGAKLDSNLRAHLSDGRASEILEDYSQIQAKISQVTTNRCRSELQPVLPPHVYHELAARDFESLRSVLRALFADWIKEE